MCLLRGVDCSRPTLPRPRVLPQGGLANSPGCNPAWPAPRGRLHQILKKSDWKKRSDLLLGKKKTDRPSPGWPRLPPQSREHQAGQAPKEPQTRKEQEEIRGEEDKDDFPTLLSCLCNVSLNSETFCFSKKAVSVNWKQPKNIRVPFVFHIIHSQAGSTLCPCMSRWQLGSHCSNVGLKDSAVFVHPR